MSYICNEIDKIAASTTIVPDTTDHNRIESSVDDVSSTIDSITNGSTLKKRNLPTNDTSGSRNIAARVKERRRPVKKRQKQPRPPVTALASPRSTQHE